MKANEFKHFMNLLKTNTRETECMGWAFLQLTDKQLVKVVDWYAKNGHISFKEKNAETWIEFGIDANHKPYSFPYSVYEDNAKRDLRLYDVLAVYDEVYNNDPFTFTYQIYARTFVDAVKTFYRHMEEDETPATVVHVV